MGNDQSTVIDEERKMLESLYQISEGRLDTDDRNHVNSKVNTGTSAPNCQPSHTLKEIEEDRLQKEEEERRMVQEEIREAERLAGLLDMNDSQHREYLEQQRSRERLDSQSSSGSAKSSQQSLSQQQQQQQQQQQGSIGSYVQMAKTGYQELVNAIIR